MECGIKYVIWILLVLQMIIGFFGFGTGGAVLSALLVIQLNDTMIDDQETSWYKVSSWNCSDSNYDHHILDRKSTWRSQC